MELCLITFFNIISLCLQSGADPMDATLLPLSFLEFILSDFWHLLFPLTALSLSLKYFTFAGPHIHHLSCLVLLPLV